MYQAVPHELLAASWWCIQQFHETGVRIVAGEGIFYHAATEDKPAEVGYDIDPNHREAEHFQMIHELAHHMEGYSHRHEDNWGLDNLIDQDGDYMQEAYDREDVVDCIVYLINQKFNIPIRR